MLLGSYPARPALHSSASRPSYAYQPPRWLMIPSGQRSAVTLKFTAANMPVHSWHGPPPVPIEAHQNAVHYLQVVDKSTTAHERHDFGDAGRLLYDFLWGEFADWYIEAAKARLYGQDPQAALQTRQVRHLLYITFSHSQNLTAHLTYAQTGPCLHLVKGRGCLSNVSLCVVL